MIKISEEVISTYIEQKDKDGTNYIKRVFDQAKTENPELLSVLWSSALNSAETLTQDIPESLEKQKLLRTMVANMMFFGLSVYHCISMQYEVNELEETYG